MQRRLLPFLAVLLAGMACRSASHARSASSAGERAPIAVASSSLPLQASVQVEIGKNGICGGTVIGKHDVLFAAHCALYADSGSYRVAIPADLVQGRRRLDVVTVRVHPGYLKDLTIYDVAVVSTQESLLDAGLRAATISTNYSTLQVGDTADFVVRNPRGDSLTTRTAEVRELVNLAKWPAFVNVALNGMICPGDSGSGLFSHHGDDAPELVGVASAVMTSQADCLDQAGYTFAGSFLDWIQNQHVVEDGRLAADIEAKDFAAACRSVSYNHPMWKRFNKVFYEIVTSLPEDLHLEFLSDCDAASQIVGKRFPAWHYR